MAIMPRGIVGTWATMNESDSDTAFAESEFAAGVPLQRGDGEDSAVPLEDGGVFIGIALGTNTMGGTATSDGMATFEEGAIFGVADMGCVFVLAGDDVTEGATPFYDPATRSFHGATGSGYLPIPNAAFDESAAEGDAVPLKIRVVPGTAAVTAET